MAYICKSCGKQYDVTLFQFGKSIICDCGELVNVSEPITIRLIKKTKNSLIKEEEAKYRELQRDVDRVCSLILITDYPDIDIRIEIEKVKKRFIEVYPDKLYLYELIYESRFKRLFRQFRNQSD